ncbi:MAG: DUF192 domain-containing protein [Halodesulfurarchaeum sp.]
MNLVRERDGDRHRLASRVETADSFFEKMRGLMFRRSVPEDFALVFRFDEVEERDVHMLFVPFPIDVLWIVDGVVREVDRLSPWTGTAREEADTLVELPAGRADAVEIGDSVRLVPANAVDGVQE